MSEDNPLSHLEGRISFLAERLGRAKAVVFDVDGVLIDSERYHFNAHQKALESVDVFIDKAFYIDHGISRDPRVFYEEAFSHNNRALTNKIFDRVNNARNQIYQDLQRVEGIIPIKQAVLLARALHEADIPLGVSSQVGREEALRNLDLLGIAECFRFVVAGDDIAGFRKKPYPDLYLEVAARLGVNATDCIAIEDSSNGVNAAVTAGMICVAVPNEYTLKHNFSGALVLPSCSEILKAWETVVVSRQRFAFDWDN